MRVSHILSVVCLLITSGIIASSDTASLKTPTPAYLVGPEDIITVTINRHPEFSGDFLVTSDGSISFPAIGQISVSNKTLEDISNQLMIGLSTRLRKPEINVTLKTPHIQRVYVLGAVDKPGLYDLKPHWRITEALATAGGLGSGVELSDCNVVILRAADGQRVMTKLSSALQGDPKENVPVYSGDVITIEAQETLPVYIAGKVKSPGLYRIRRDSAGIIEALTLAGGTTEDSALDRITITHLNNSYETVNLSAGMRDGKQDKPIKLSPGDLILVPEEMSRIAVLGYVRDPGYFVIRNGQSLTLSDALGLAKGAEKRGNMESIVIIRTEKGKQTRQAYDFYRYLRNGDLKSNPEIIPGDVVYVPQTGRPDGETILRSLSAIGLLLGPFIP